MPGERYWLIEALDVTADGEGIVLHAGLALLRLLADKTGVTAGVWRALATSRLLVHDRRASAGGPSVRDHRRRRG